MHKLAHRVAIQASHHAASRGLSPRALDISEISRGRRNTCRAAANVIDSPGSIATHPLLGREPFRGQREFQSDAFCFALSSSSQLRENPRRAGEPVSRRHERPRGHSSGHCPRDPDLGRGSPAQRQAQHPLKSHTNSSRVHIQAPMGLWNAGGMGRSLGAARS